MTIGNCLSAVCSSNFIKQITVHHANKKTCRINQIIFIKKQVQKCRKIIKISPSDQEQQAPSRAGCV